MGQKINPLGFRLGTTQEHYSVWFEEPKYYSEGLQEDEKIRDCIKNYVHKNIQQTASIELEGTIARIEIKKAIDEIKVITYMVYQKPTTEKDRKKIKKIINELKMNIEKKIHCRNRKLKIVIKRILKPYRQPKILAAFLAGQILSRVPFRKAMKQAVELAQKEKIKGIRIHIAGRINGRDMARVEKIEEGRIPLQTIRAKINYYSYSFRTIHGILGIKIWVFLGER